MSDHRWRKSSYSPDASNCVEVATTPAAVLIRDSKTTSGPRLGLSPTAWAVFLAHLTK
ncbi:DUF397 domain-containing protein [Streptomyces sp. RK31]|uniref:DUF397 domain-containing protein n=1 Tax=Streptomyces griseoincarnatus TaxID=29305 RepID=A0ABT0W0T7_STRGI|nr:MULTISPECIES: DUF397 domain-containing protein [Streptomyces]MBJ6616349.1 DUF397 domain-containing protein [Streptomyces sp. I3(2020)]MBJ6627015.1 DUF397 domain-containing protein [Streptomyces sp. I4(2020)]MBQ0974084.1 DUF397 domain-containing protein [Streptomyces sp. RK31]MBU5944110.1 DUF397 domain-containing protein [Streptomyces sp. PAM3C]MCM2517204.1 DUF397 domain-containing protein [Streptomyces griseoincarnatus]